MNFTTIKMLLRYLPESPELEQSNFFGGRNPSVAAGPVDREVLHFTLAYKDLSLGWKAARMLAKHSLPFPCFIQGEDNWLFKAYLYCLDKDKYHNEHVAHARAIASGYMRGTHQALNAMFVSDDIDYKEIAEAFSLDIQTVKAYEKLFFNIVDRRDDHLFLRNVVYPNGRLVEMYDKYLQTEDLENLLLRTGYNNGAKHVLHFAGFKSGLLNSLTIGDVPSKLESLFMANGYLLARNGWLNQREDAVGVYNARNLIQAAKQGGVEEVKSSPFSSVADTLGAEIALALETDASKKLNVAQQHYSTHATVAEYVED